MDEADFDGCFDGVLVGGGAESMEDFGPDAIDFAQAYFHFALDFFGSAVAGDPAEDLQILNAKTEEERRFMEEDAAILDFEREFGNSLCFDAVVVFAVRLKAQFDPCGLHIPAFGELVFSGRFTWYPFSARSLPNDLLFCTPQPADDKDF